MKAKKLYVVPELIKKRFVNVYGVKHELNFTGISKGCAGVMPVFTNKRMAEKYAGKYKHLIISMEVIDVKKE